MESVMANPRVKVTLQIPPGTLAAVDAVAKDQLGIGRGTFFAVAALMLLAQVAASTGGAKRSIRIRELESEFQAVIDKARKAA
jgi:hypothetical protein